MDFVRINKKRNKSGKIEISPKYIVCKVKDLMVRNGDPYGIWNDNEHMWSKDVYEVQRLIDHSLLEAKEKETEEVICNTLEDFSNGKWEEFKRYAKSLPNSYIQLDSKVAFLNTNVKREDYISWKLPYIIDEGSIDGYDELMRTLYSPEERAKLEWAIGSIIHGDSKKIQKFIVIYGEPGSGKSTVLDIYAKLLTKSKYETHCSAFVAKDLVGKNNTFASEAFKDNPLISIQHDGNLSTIADYSVLNSIISHEPMLINEKNKAQYTSNINALLFMGTNEPVNFANAKVGLIRRLLDVHPTNMKLEKKKYDKVLKQVDFELGAIAAHCLKVYNTMGINYYNDYIPESMILQTDMFFNYVEENYLVFKNEDGTTLKAAFEMYKFYCTESELKYTLDRNKFREELKNYFREFYNEKQVQGKHLRKVYVGFKSEKFKHLFNQEANENIMEPAIINEIPEIPEIPENPFLMAIESEDSYLEACCTSCPAQYAGERDIPTQKWKDVKTTLKDIDTSKVHFVDLPENHIIIDFDIKDESGDKSYKMNLIEASRFPSTYTELSKSGGGIHLHYIYDGDKSLLNNVYDGNPDIEIKTFIGKSTLRRKFTKCNNEEIAHMKPGMLPLKEDKKVINFEGVKNENMIRNMIKKNLNKEIHPGTKSSIDFIAKILEDSYKDGINYDVTDLRPKVLVFANNSTNQALTCIKMVSQMQFKSEEYETNVEVANGYTDQELVFFDVEVFPNLFVIVWKIKGKDCVKMINPTPAAVESLLNMKLVGFNCRRYDNHILYARLIGYTNHELYILSQKIVNGSRNGMFSEAYNISFTDVFDFASAGNKKSLKKFEIELGIHHLELGLPWDEPVAEELWDTVADYCINDVVATEATFDYLASDYTARLILAELSGLTPNDTTNAHSTKIMFGNNKKPQNEFIYTDLREDFPGYKFSFGKSTYKGKEVGEGGYVESEPGVYGNVALLDVASMHPTSIEELVLFGPKYTKVFSDIKNARLAIKHGDYELASTMLEGKLAKFLKNKDDSEGLSNALKTVINSIYGLTSAKFENPFRDPRNVDNIVAKRGSLFMINLGEEVRARGFIVAHIKTDSIKIPEADTEIIQFVMDYGKKYGYTFEHEATYDKMCLVNDAVYIAKYKWAEKEKNIGKWSATGTQFKQPYVFKTLFTKEPILLEDMCETKAVQTALYLDMNEGFKDTSVFDKVQDTRMAMLTEAKITNKDLALAKTWEHLSDEELDAEVAKGHDYRFIGKVSSFCPMKPGTGGGVLLREKDGSYYAASGSKGFRWLEADMVKTLGKESDIDESFYIKMADTAADAIRRYADFDWFTSNDPYVNGDSNGKDNQPLGNDGGIPAPIGDDEEDIPF
ncbi:MAG: DUF5906 domain-containing protein [Bacilli bacterium]